uniref:Unconventional myosin-IXb n=2 Tax=Plectus sambesii TaxID=2011161 RepID=A0A914XBB0_9BILA
MSLNSDSPQDQLGVCAGVFPRRALTISVPDDAHTQTVEIFLHRFNPDNADHRIRVEFHKRSTSEELIQLVLNRGPEWSNRSPDDFDLYEVMGTLDGQTFKERKLDKGEYPVAVQMLWTRPMPTSDDQSVPKNRFVMRQKGAKTVGGAFGSAEASSTIDSFLAKFLSQPQDKEYPDLCMLPELTEQTLLDNLRDRFNSGHIYTYIGPILVAVNPFKFFPIYNPKYARLYYQSRRLGALPPHIFAVADVTYHNLLRIKKNQCIVISGESGSGKTESTNFLLHHLTTLSQKGAAASSVEQTLLCAGPVLEAFGNAVTVQNNNSSRFGKFLRVNYRENGMVSGANVQIYLLEKSRIISQAIGERNYHVFYYLLDGATDEERKRHFLLQPKDYNYLNQHNFFRTEGVNEKYEFDRLRHSMELVGFSQGSQQKIFNVLSAVLLLGNIEYIKRPGYHSDETAYVANEEIVSVVADLLQVRADHLLPALTLRRTVMKNDTVVTRYKVAEANNTRDAMAKCLYNALFHWIVLRINQALLKRDTSLAQKGYYIGILDIFGFEDVGGQWNSFEQLCINYANEHLQAYFNQHIFQFEQEEYFKEGISWTNIEYTDNTECVQLFESKPYGLFCLVDEESKIKNGTDESMLEKLNQFLKTNEYYEIPQKREFAFIIAHYAGKVKYQITGFREKNKDLMRQEVVTALKNSKSAFVRELVSNDPVAVYRWAVLRSTFRALYAFRQAGRKLKRSESMGHLHVPNEPQPSGSRRGSESQLSVFLRGELNPNIVPDFCDTSVFETIVEQARKTQPKPKERHRSGMRGLLALKALVARRPQQHANKQYSVSAQFQHSLTRLMDTLDQATPYFIRCIKSNNEKVPYHFDDNIILRQLRYTGMLETVRIRRAGYSVRIEYAVFINQYRILLPHGRQSTKADVEQFILDHPLIETQNVQYGKTKLFMREAEKLLLDDQLHRTIMTHINRLQSWFRTVLARRRFLHTRSGVVKIQALVRGVMARNRLRSQVLAAVCIQAAWRGSVQRNKYRRLRDQMVQLQAHVRGVLFRRRYAEERASGRRTIAPLSKNNGMILESAQPMAKLFEINTFFHAFELPSFDLNNPRALAASFGDSQTEFGLGDSDSESTSSGFELDDSVMEPFRSDLAREETKRSEDSTELEATFILEDARLKLIEETPQASSRRRSLATSGSSGKLKMLRRAASTESDQILNRAQHEQISPESLSAKASAPQSPTAKSANKNRRLGFIRARRQIKAFLSRKSDSLQSESEEERVDEHNSPPTTTSTPLGSKKVKNKPKTLVLGIGKSTTLSMDALVSHPLKLARIPKGDLCALCAKAISGILVQGYKCNTCKLCFHKECSQFACKLPCTAPISGASPDQPRSRKPWDVADLIRSPRPPRQSLSPIGSGSGIGIQPHHGSFSLTKAKQQIDPANMIVESMEDLRQFSVFIFKKQMNLSAQDKKKRDTMVDAIFKKSLREFHMELISYEAVLNEDKTVLKYRDLITTFEGSLSKVCIQEQVTFPVTLGVNAFRGFLNEFMQQQSKRKGSKQKNAKTKSFRKKRRRSDVTVMHNGHRFKAEIVHVPTYCELCNQFMWHAEKIFICIGCRISCHKKCHSKTVQACTMTSDNPSEGGGRVFAAELAMLVDEDTAVPIVIEKLLISLELRGLYVEGLYRKTGSVAQVRQVRKTIETTPNFDTLSFEDTPVHVASTVVKAFFRELPEPLLTFDLYENFLNVSEMDQPMERLRCLSVMVELLPKCNKCLLDRLMYHLARVAHQEEVNKMGASNLALIFAPCLLRRNQVVHAQEQLLDVNRQAICVQALIEEKLRQYRATVNQIVELEHATEKVTENLRLIDDHVRRTSEDMALGQEAASAASKEMQAARQLFVEQLEFLDKEKDKLIEELPPLAPVASSEDDCLTSSDEQHTPPPSRRAARARALLRATQQAEEYAVDLVMPPTFSTLTHVTKARTRRPRGQRRPSIRFLHSTFQVQYYQE